MPGAYLDWNATTPLRSEARDAWLAVQAEDWGNPASVHRPGQRARQRWDATMRRLADLLGCRPHELVFTSGGTEANATAIAGALADGGRAACSAIEHSSVLRNCERHAESLTLVPVDKEGRVTDHQLDQAICGPHEPPEDPLAALDEDATPPLRLLCLHYANNELGTIQDLEDLLAFRGYADLVLVDACQGVGKERIDIGAIGADMVSIAGHKFGAPRGTGLLYVRTGVALPPLLAGGRQQEDRRSGSEDLAGLCALTAALEASLACVEDECERERDLLDGCLDAIRAELPDARRLAPGARRLANTLSLAHPEVDAEALVARLDLAGFAVSRASACMARSGEPSHVIAALGLPPELAMGVIRVSIGWTTTAEDLAAFAAAYVREVRAMLG